ncbi:hypothetical protein [Nitrosomonas nitrosa]|uniref:hypothetical protein n=1 Tax=Nitrosomonas nitrosa TaxID=52442 RepID=UPI0015A4F4CC|nr:hypothetical protein [Nitrosomonas nitrosa]
MLEKFSILELFIAFNRFADVMSIEIDYFWLSKVVNPLVVAGLAEIGDIRLNA